MPFRQHCADAFRLPGSALRQGSTGPAKFEELPRFPGMTRDVAMEVPADLPHAKVAAFFATQKEPLFIASEVFDDAEFHKVGVEATAYLRITYPTDACPEALDSEGECPAQDHVVGTAAAHGVAALFIQPGPPDRRVLRVGAGRQMSVSAGAGATLHGVCQGVLVNMINAFITAGSGRPVAAD